MLIWIGRYASVILVLLVSIVKISVPVRLSFITTLVSVQESYLYLLIEGQCPSSVFFYRGLVVVVATDKAELVG